MAEATERWTCAAMLQALRASHAEMEARIAPLTAAQMTTPGVNGVNGEWTMRDMLAHLTAWQRRALALLEGARDGIAPDPFFTDTTDETEIDRRNAVFFAESHVRPLADVLADWRATERAIEAILPAVPEDALHDPARFPWLHGRTLAGNVAGETYEHAADHLPDIDAFLAKEGAGHQGTKTPGEA